SGAVQHALELANGYLLERGITSASDANTGSDMVAQYAEATGSGRLQVRVNLMVGWAGIVKRSGRELPGPQDLQPSRAGVSHHQLHVGQAKLFADGAITTRTCWLSAPFDGEPENVGMPIHEPGKLQELISLAHNAGWQLAVHAIGDRAIEQTLKCFAEAQRLRTRANPGHRIEHCMLLNDELISRLRRQNVWSIGQPEFLCRLGDGYISALGQQRAAELSPYKTLEERGIAQAFSSDCPVVPGSPLDGIRAAMLRTAPSGKVLNAGQAISAETALRLYTSAPAFATRSDKDRGSIEPGKWGDFTVLSSDPLTSALDDWDSIRVTATFVGGKCLYGADALAW
ncbi:MAG TPA: amidohydrolase family protein, partial [Chthonomonadales bacterium]|nr:amidohydrolase family protein [Chthonomonadales bacterium]